VIDKTLYFGAGFFVNLKNNDMRIRAFKDMEMFYLTKVARTFYMVDILNEDNHVFDPIVWN
jgi:hypothetical protein